MWIGNQGDVLEGHYHVHRLIQITSDLSFLECSAKWFNSVISYLSWVLISRKLVMCEEWERCWNIMIHPCYLFRTPLWYPLDIENSGSSSSVDKRHNCFRYVVISITWVTLESLKPFILWEKWHIYLKFTCYTGTSSRPPADTTLCRLRVLNNKSSM